MKTLSLRLPNSLHEKFRQLAEAEGVSMNQFIATAAAEKLAALMTDEYLAERGQRARRSKFRKALSCTPDRPADAEDEIYVVTLSISGLPVNVRKKIMTGLARRVNA
ncbi:MAG: YlcI/YnfO family protein [Rhodothermales bacterium]